MRFLASFLMLAVASAATVTPAIAEAFKNFQVKYNKSYGSEEFAVRLAVFAENLEKVQGHNMEHLLQGGEAVFGVTKFMDLTEEEFKAKYLTYRPREIPDEERVTPTRFGKLGASVDWRTKGALTPVKDQGQCGSCWAFSATEAIESYAMLAGNPLQELSPQQITSCDTVDLGCNGGNTETAYAYVQKAGGLQSNKAYPYTSGAAGVTGKCKFDSTQVVQKIAGFKAVAKGEANLKSALNAGPVSVCLAASKFQTYTSGILKTCDNQVDHCVQAVGYDDAASTPYWIVRNSWAADWGEDGYIRIESGKDLCKIADDVTYPTF